MQDSKEIDRFYGCNFPHAYLFKLHAIYLFQGKSSNFTLLQSGTLRYLGPVDLKEYYIRNYTMTVSKIEDERTVLIVEVVLSRRLLSIVLTCYIPTVLLNVISHATNYFRPDLFDITVQINLTTMLVLTTLFISVRTVLKLTLSKKFKFNIFLPREMNIAMIKDFNRIQSNY